MGNWQIVAVEDWQVVPLVGIGAFVAVGLALQLGKWMYGLYKQWRDEDPLADVDYRR